MFPPFFMVDHKLLNRSSDWAAKRITTCCMSNDIAVVLIILFGKTIQFGLQLEVPSRCKSHC